MCSPSAITLDPRSILTLARWIMLAALCGCAHRRAPEPESYRPIDPFPHTDPGRAPSPTSPRPASWCSAPLT